MAKAKKRKVSKHTTHPYRKPPPPPSKPSLQKSQPSKSSKPNPTTPQSKQKTFLPFSPSDSILLVGEGDFSFTLSLLQHHACTRITATSYDSLPTLLTKYPHIQPTLDALNAAPERVRLFHGIDAMKLGKASGGGGKRLREGWGRSGDGDGKSEGKGYRRIIFNFPHTGGLSTDVNRQVRANQALLVGFFREAIPLLDTSFPSSSSLSPSSSFSPSPSPPPSSPSSNPHEKTYIPPPPFPPTITITLFTREPYTLWNVKDLARHVGLRVQRSFAWDWDAYPGYRHARTLGVVHEGRGGGERERGERGEGGGGWKGEEREARAWVFEGRGEEGGGGGGRGRGKEEDEDEDDD